MAGYWLVMTLVNDLPIPSGYITDGWLWSRYFERIVVAGGWSITSFC